MITDVAVLLDWIVLSASYSAPITSDGRLWATGYYWRAGISSPRIRITMGYGEVGSSTVKTVKVSVDTTPQSSVTVRVKDMYGNIRKTMTYSLTAGSAANQVEHRENGPTVTVDVTNRSCDKIKTAQALRIHPDYANILPNCH